MQRYQVLTAGLSFQRTQENNPTVPVGDPLIVERGGDVPDWAPTYLVNALFNSGVIVPVGPSGPREDLIPVADVPVMPGTPDQPPAPLAPGGMTTPLTLAELTGDTPTPPPADDQSGGDVESPSTVRPAPRDSKAAWEDYAAGPAVGMDRTEAESLTKAELIAEVERRESPTQLV